MPQREIKFRAWDENMKRMLQPSVNMLIDSYNGSMYWQFGYQPLDPMEHIPLQFTGLYDANGVEIFEGDIIEDNVGMGSRFEVLYRCGAFMMERRMNASLGDKDSGWVFDTLQENADGDNTMIGHKIIGNIYENPEFLHERDR